MKSPGNREKLLDAWLTLAEDVPQGGEPIRLPVLTGSMLPRIPVGSLIEVEKCRADRCLVGDVVVYRRGDRLVVHRLLCRLALGGGRLFFEKGDANDLGGWVRGRHIKGRVVAVVVDEQRRPLGGDPERARTSLAAHRRNLLLWLPRRMKRFLFGR